MTKRDKSLNMKNNIEIKIGEKVGEIVFWKIFDKSSLTGELRVNGWDYLVEQLF